MGSSGRVERAKERESRRGLAAFCVLFLYSFFSIYFLFFAIARLCFVTSWRSMALCESEKWLFIVKNEMWLVLTATLTVCVCVCV